MPPVCLLIQTSLSSFVPIQLDTSKLLILKALSWAVRCLILDLSICYLLGLLAWVWVFVLNTFCKLNGTSNGFIRFGLTFVFLEVRAKTLPWWCVFPLGAIRRRSGSFFPRLPGTEIDQWTQRVINWCLHRSLSHCPFISWFHLSLTLVWTPSFICFPNFLEIFV